MDNLKNSYEEIKNSLLADENINDVFIDESKHLIIVKPNNLKAFTFLEEPFKNFMSNFHIILGNREFKISQSVHDKNSIFTIELREAYRHEL